MPVVDPKIERHRLDVQADDATALLRGADALVHLAFADGDGDGRSGPRRVGRRRRHRLLLDAAAAAGVRHVVALSSALVYGAWPNNPLPLTEDAPLRPNAELPYAVDRARAELLLASWAADEPGPRRRGAAPVHRAGAGRVELRWPGRWPPPPACARSRRSRPASSCTSTTSPSAVDVVRRARLDGPCNVAPDGWIAGDVVRDLGGVAPHPACR